MARRDPHSYADDTQGTTKHFDLKAKVDFATQTIAGVVTLHFAKPVVGTLDLDTRDLTIERVDTGQQQVLDFVLHAAEPHIGQRLEIAIPAPIDYLMIAYRTAPGASALQWLAPAQTSGKQHPFLFSQCQAIHARSLIPLQDTPRMRVTYTAELTVPDPLVAVMAAAATDRTPDPATQTTTYGFSMPQSIPPYLFAFAVGDLTSRELSPRSRVWAEPSVVDKAAWEFAGVEAMIVAAEQLFGPYDWERFDILTMPPSFPYGGMENPRLTFLTPTLLAGDRSLVSVVAHELAHSWTGNLVTNANAEHFWLNEGFTMYAERRIVEALDGREMAVLHAALGRRELDESIERFKDTPGMTRLRTHLEGIDPDEGYSLVPYEKGYFFLAALEQEVGRERFTAWLRDYLKTFAFGALTTEEWQAYFEAHLPGVLAKVGAAAWIDGEGVPASATPPHSARREAIEKAAALNEPPPTDVKWSATEWALYLESVPRPASPALCRALHEDHALTKSGNYDVLICWLTLALQSGYAPVTARAEAVVGEVGRMKYLRPIYTALPRERARTVYEQWRETYHPIARQMVEGVLSR